MFVGGQVLNVSKTPVGLKGLGGGGVSSSVFEGGAP